MTTSECLSEHALAQALVIILEKGLAPNQLEREVLSWAQGVLKQYTTRVSRLRILRSFFGKAQLSGIDIILIMYIKNPLSLVYPDGAFPDELLKRVEFFYTGGYPNELRELFTDPEEFEENDQKRA